MSVTDLMSMEGWRNDDEQGKLKNSEKNIPVLPCLSWISLEIILDWTWGSGARSHCLAGWEYLTSVYFILHKHYF